MTCESPFRQPLAGLHVHFFLKTHQLCRHGDHGAFVASSEWLDVSYDALMRKLLFNGLGAATLHVVAPAAMPFAETVTTGAITLAVWLRGNVGVAAGRTDTRGLTKFEPKELERLRVPKLERFPAGKRRAIAMRRIETDAVVVTP